MKPKLIVMSKKKSKADKASADSTEVSLVFPVLSQDEAELMIYHFLSSPLVDHSKEAEIQRIEFDGQAIKKLLEDKKTERFRLFTAAYRENYEKPDMRNKKTVILQLTKGDKILYYDIYAIAKLVGSDAGRIPICPPPSGVCSLTFASTLEEVKANLYK